MCPPMNIRLVRACRIAAFGLSLAIALSAIVVLAGWTFGLQALTTFGARGVAMNPLTAVCLLLLAGALQVALPGGASAAERWSGRLLASAAGALGVTKLAMLGSSHGPDTWMFRAAIESVSPVNRMAPNTALLLTLLAAAILLLDVEFGRARRPAQWLVLAALPITLVVLVGFWFGVSDLYGWGAYIPMARNTAIALVALELAILAARVEHGVTRIFAGTGSGAVTARRLAPAALILPLAFGYVRLVGQRQGLFGSEFGTVLFSLAKDAGLEGDFPDRFGLIEGGGHTIPRIGQRFSCNRFHSGSCRRPLPETEFCKFFSGIVLYIYSNS